jgi:hypothetical protein
MSMEVPDLISTETWEKVRVAMERQEHWAAYNNTLLFIHTDDIQFFTNQEDAADYAYQEEGEFDNYDVIRIDSLDDFKQKVEGIIPGVTYVPPIVTEHSVMDDGPGYFPKQLLNERKTIIMTTENPEVFQKNLEALQNKIKFMGFDEGLFKQLETKMRVRPYRQYHFW